MFVFGRDRWAVEVHQFYSLRIRTGGSFVADRPASQMAVAYRRRDSFQAVRNNFGRAQVFESQELEFGLSRERRWASVDTDYWGDFPSFASVRFAQPLESTACLKTRGAFYFFRHLPEQAAANSVGLGPSIALPRR